MSSSTDERGESDPSTLLSHVGEFELIRRIASNLSKGSAVVGIGDDAAVLDGPGSDYLLATVDMLVEGVHFRLPETAFDDLGRRAIAVNVSDIAAMGGSPTFALVSLALPHSVRLSDIEVLYEGLRDEGETYGVSIVGGNLTATSGPLSVDTTMLGRVPRNEVVLRSGGRPGDLLAVTGTLGHAAAQQIAHERGIGLAESKELRAGAIDVPMPRLAEGRALASGHLVHAMLDISDGLAGDLHHLCEASEVGAVVRSASLPIRASTHAIAEIAGVDAIRLALGGGEDYELLAAIPPDAFAPSRAAVAPTELTIVGELVEAGAGIALEDEHGSRVPLAAEGWTHF
ncbi:MAG TPA: thiamine-phosphate kinase [Chloroflexota bacterium]